jgi:hypothetical protein
MFTIIFGTVVETNEMSNKDRLERKTVHGYVEVRVRANDDE